MSKNNESGDPLSKGAKVQAENREWLLDELEEIVYISDIQDYTLFYLNRAGRELTGFQLKECETEKCFRVLQGRDSPCPFCTNARLIKEKFYVWEYENPFLGKNFIVKDKLVDWNGKLVRMEIAVNVGDRRYSDTNKTSKYHMETVMLESLKLLNTAKSLKEAINRTLEMIGEFYDGERAYIIEIDRENGFARNTYEWCKMNIPSQKTSLQNVPLDAIPYIFETFNKSQHLIVPRVEALRNAYPSEYQFLTSRGAHSLFAVPFDNTTGFSGYIGVDNPNINQDTIKLLDTIAYNIANEIKKRRLYERLEYEAGHDALSGLLNRSSFVRYQEEMQNREDVSCGVVTADINGLKQLNRDFGHRRGDETIRDVTGIMKAGFPKEPIFRLSGDEFVIIAPSQSYEDFMGRVRQISRELDCGTPNGVSLGSTWSEHLNDIELLIRHAEELMLVNKQLYYKNSDNVRKHYSPEAVKSLKKEIEEKHYKLYLQPQFSSESGELKSAEALVRYQAPGKDLTPPSRFVPMLEKQKLIRYLDFYMLEEVCRLLGQWQAEGKTLVPISVNFSRITLLESDLFEVLEQIKSKFDIPYELITIEITERVGDIEHKVIEMLGSQLKQAGFKLSLDDFGADYANMSILSIVRFDEVKLDKSLIDNLVSNETNQKVVKSIIEMCHHLNVECVAEGVETLSQLEMLRSFGCTLIQGYYYSRPVSVDAFLEQMEKGSKS